MSPASASPSELRLAFKLRDLELKAAGAYLRERIPLERAFNIFCNADLRAPYDALLAVGATLCRARCAGTEQETLFRDGLGTFWHQSGTARWAVTRCRWLTAD